MASIQKALSALLLASLPAFAGTVCVELERTGYAGPVEIRVGIPQEDGEPKWIQATRLRTESSVALEPLPAGTYVVLVSGDAPFERFATTAGVRGEGDEVLRVTLPPSKRLSGTIRLGKEPAGDAVLNFRHRHFGWTTSFTARPDGTFETPLWQEGEFILFARGGALPGGVRRPVRIEGATLSVDLSPLRITGVVADAEGVPIPDATVALRAETGRDAATVRVSTDGHGMFDFADVKSGPYAVTVVADGYLISAENHVYVSGETPVERLAVTMASGLPRPLRIVDAAGRPVANAAVNVTSDARLCSMAVTDLEGRVTVSIPTSGSSVAWVLPSTGSMAVVRLEAGDAAAGAQKVVVPDGSASVVIDVLTPDRSGVAGVALLMRYNGELLLPRASAAFGLRTDEKGRAKLIRVPPGLYEFWPFGSDEEAATLIASQAFSPAPAPIAIEAAEGESRATVVVEKKVGVVQ